MTMVQIFLTTFWVIKVKEDGTPLGIWLRRPDMYVKVGLVPN